MTSYFVVFTDYPVGRGMTSVHKIDTAPAKIIHFVFNPWLQCINSVSRRTLNEVLLTGEKIMLVAHIWKPKPHGTFSLDVSSYPATRAPALAPMFSYILLPWCAHGITNLFFLNIIIIFSEAEKYPNVTVRFNHKMTGGKLDEGEISFVK